MQDGDDAPEPKDRDSARPPSLAPSVPPPGGARPSQASSPRVSLPPDPLRWTRLLVAFVWIAGQIALVLTAERRSDAAFGFRMFNESSTLKVSLFREVESGNGNGEPRTRIHVDDGQWKGHDSYGMVRLYAWNDRVRRPELGIFDREIGASYGAAAQLARFQSALDDAAAHIDDVDTRRLALDITVKKNGREPYVLHLVSPELGAAQNTKPGGH